jgi:Cys-rich protein (TIGR01571 family)
MSRNWIGGAGKPPATSNTFMIVYILFIVYVVLWIIFCSVMIATVPTCDLVWEKQPGYDSGSSYGSSYGYDYGIYDDYEIPVMHCTSSGAYIAMWVFLVILNILFWVYFVVVMFQTRRTIRNKYNIPPSSCGDCEDFCCTLWCSCCAIDQMARHTNDYSAYPVECCSGACFNKTGQPAGAPVIVV